ncbi:TPA: helix-turn-helix domain-containing protein [Streptococcus agalactiae]
MLGENIYLQRTQIGMTQENLSDYLHLTKTTISKWENNQAKPDIDYLILMANLFDISLDDLVGYQKTLSDDQRNQLIKDLKIKANVLSERDFFQEVKELSKQFPNDFKTLLIMINMVLSNLTNLNDSEMKEWSLSTLNKIISKTVVESDLQTAIMFKTVVLFHNLEYDEVINLYQNSPYKLGEELLLANSFFAKGDVYRAKQVLQVEIYQQILLVCEYLLSLSTFEVEENKGDIFERLEHMIEAFQLNSLHPNTVIKCYYSLACHYSKSDDDKALGYLKQCFKSLKQLLQRFELHGDTFFYTIDDWLETIPTDIAPPTSQLQVIERVEDLFQNSQFKELSGRKEFQQIIQKLNDLKKDY